MSATAAIDVSGGEALRAKLLDTAKRLGKGQVLRVGFLEGATYPTTPTQHLRAAYKRRARNRLGGSIKGAEGGMTVAQVAAADEWGDPAHNRPPRPFFRNMIAAKKSTWSQSMANILKNTNYDVPRTLALMGEGIRGQLQDSIREFTTPELADSTKERKGFDKPLIDTSHMLMSVDYEVVAE